MIYIKLDENEGATVKASGTSETELANNVDNININISITAYYFT